MLFTRSELCYFDEKYLSEKSSRVPRISAPVKISRSARNDSKKKESIVGCTAAYTPRAPYLEMHRLAKIPRIKLDAASPKGISFGAHPAPRSHAAHGNEVAVKLMTLVISLR